LDYTGSTKTVTLVAGTTFTAAATDNISVMGRAPLQPTTAGRTLDVSAGGEAGIDWANVGTPGSTVSLSATTVGSVSAVTSVAALGTGAITAASIATDAIDADALATDAVNEIRNAITGGAYDLDTDANGRIRVVDGTAAGEINTASGVVQAALADGVTHGGTTADFLARDISIGGDVNVVGSVVLDNAGNDIRGVRLSTTGINAVADQVWLETLADHSGTAGSTAAALNAAGSAGDPWATALPGAYGSGTAGKIIGDNINATISSRASQTTVDDIPTNAELSTALGTADDAVLAAIAALNNLSQANIRTAVGLASANLDTQLDALPTNAELATALGTADDAVLAAIAALNNVSTAQVQTSCAAALTAYDPPTHAELTSGLAAADDATLAAIAALNNLSAAQVTAAVWAADVNANDNTVGSFGDFFGQLYEAATVDIQTQIAALNDLDAAGIRGAIGLASANLDTQLDALPTANEVRNAVTGGAYPLDTDANGRVRIVDGTGVGEIDTNGGAIASVLALGATALASVNAEVVDALNVDTYAEPSQGAPAATASIQAKLAWLYTAWRNKKIQDSTTLELYADDGTTILAKSTKSDDGTDFTSAEYITGA